MQKRDNHDPTLRVEANLCSSKVHKDGEMIQKSCHHASQKPHSRTLLVGPSSVWRPQRGRGAVSVFGGVGLDVCGILVARRGETVFNQCGQHAVSIGISIQRRASAQSGTAAAARLCTRPLVDAGWRFVFRASTERGC